jgi:hypothetical protein
MAPIYIRGGLPAHVNGTAQVAVLRTVIPEAVANYLWFRNNGANPITLTLSTEDDATAGIGVAVASGATWEGPAEIGFFWTKATGGASAFEAIAFRRRG